MQDLNVTVSGGLFLSCCEWIKGIFGFYFWEPKDRLLNEATTDIKHYPKDIKFKDGDLCVENGRLALVSGAEAFQQHLQKFISTTIGEICYAPDYGCEFANSIFKAKNKEFKRQCEYLAKAILEHKTFKNYIEEIYAIGRRKEHFFYGYPKLRIEFKVKGIADTFIVELFNIKDLLKKWQNMREKDSK